MNTKEKLYELCLKFRDDHHISCPEAISQVDSIIEDAYEFIEDIMNTIGYYEYGEDE